MYPNGWPKEGPQWYKRTQVKEPPKELQTHNLPCNDVEILTVQIREQIYYSQISRGLFPDEQKGCCKGSWGTAELLYIGEYILNESKTRRKNLVMAWIYNKKSIWYVSA